MNYSAIIEYLESVLNSNGLHKSVNNTITDTGTMNLESGYVIEITSDTVSMSNANNVDERELKLDIHVAKAKSLHIFHEAQIHLLQTMNAIRETIRNTAYNTLAAIGVSYIDARNITIKINEIGNIVATLDVTITY